MVLNRGAAEPLGARDTSRGQPVSKLGIYLHVYCNQGCSQIGVKEKKAAANRKRLINIAVFLTARIGGSRLRSIGFMMMKTCWFLCVKPVSSRRAALQKYYNRKRNNKV